MKSLSHIVLHDESLNTDKHSHLHIIVSNIIDNDVIKRMTQYNATYCVKKSVNHSVKVLLNEDNYKYTPKNTAKTNKPLWAARHEKAKKLETKLFLIKKSIESIKKNLPVWAKTFLADMFKIAEIKAKSIAFDINIIDEISPDIADDFDHIVNDIEEINHKAPDPVKVSTKRKRRRRKNK